MMQTPRRSKTDRDQSLNVLAGAKRRKILRRDFGGRVAELIKLFDGSSNLARATGLGESVIRSLADGTSEPRRDTLIILAWGAGVTLEWLVTGIGPRDVSDPAASPATALPTLQPDIDTFDGFILIPRLDVRASAGPGALIEREHVIDHMAFRAEWLRSSLGVDPSKLVLITADGDSMEPVIRAGDLLLVDTSVDRLTDDAIYVLVKAGETVVKRVQRFFNGAVAIRSDNPAYVEETMDADQAGELVVAGRVRWIARMI